MILPIGTDRPLRRPTLVTYALLAANAAMFAVSILADSRSGSPRLAGLLDALALHPAAPTVWGFITYQFLHGGPLHLAGNMLFLWTFGPNVEDRLGRWWFLLFYLAGGAAAGGLHAVLTASPVIGASGAIAAVTGAYLVLFPRTLIRVFVFFFLIGIFQIPAAWFLGASIAWDILMHGRGGTNVAIGAHIGGYLFGSSLAVGLLASGLLPREPYDLFSIARQAHRRRKFKELTTTGASPWAGKPGAAAPSAREPTPAERDAMERRAALSKLLEQGDVARAGEAYRALLDAHGRAPLPRTTQLDLANRLYADGRHDLSATAYDAYLSAYGADPEAPRVRLMLALLCARRLNDPVRAKALLREAEPGLRQDAERALLAELREELG